MFFLWSCQRRKYVKSQRNFTGWHFLFSASISSSEPPFYVCKEKLPLILAKHVVDYMLEIGNCQILFMTNCTLILNIFLFDFSEKKMWWWEWILGKVRLIKNEISHKEKLRTEKVYLFSHTMCYPTNLSNKYTEKYIWFWKLIWMFFAESFSIDPINCYYHFIWMGLGLK